jgi:hypothetical protein
VNGGEVTVRDARHDGSRDEAVIRSVPTLLRALNITLIRMVPIHAGHHVNRTYGHQFPETPSIRQYGKCRGFGTTTAENDPRAGGTTLHQSEAVPVWCDSRIIPARSGD